MTRRRRGLGTRTTKAGLSSTFVAFGTADPSTILPPGTEYVWMQTDGSGNVIDIISGVSA